MKDKVLDFLKTENLYNNNKNFSEIDMIYLLKDRDYFDKVIRILRDRMIMIPLIWG